MTAIDRRFVRIAEGLVHVRHVDRPGDGRPPLVMLHASPGSSRGLEPLMEAICAAGGPALIAPDTLGNGDSTQPSEADPDIAYFAEATLRALTAMGIDRFDLYGSHTGARIACEMGILAPERIDHLIFDGIGEYDAATQALFLEHYAPEMAPDDYGRQLIWAFNFVRDQATHFPYFQRDPAHRLMTRAVPDAEELHVRALEVLKSLTSYHKSYRAAFRYATTARLPALAIGAVFLTPADDLPSLRAQADHLASLICDGRVTELDSGNTCKAGEIVRLLATPS